MARWIGRYWFAVTCAAVLVIVGVVGSTLYASKQGVDPGRAIRFADAFPRERVRFDAGVEALLAADVPDGQPVHLPGDLRDLSVNGDAWASGGVAFFPQWIGSNAAAGAGGFLYAPAGAPEGFRMYGQSCEGPRNMGDGWWACALDARTPTPVPGTERKHRVIPLAILGAFAFFGVAFLMYRGSRGVEERINVRADTWTKVAATITRSDAHVIGPVEVQRRFLATQAGGFDPPQTAVGEFPYVGDVRYDYAIEGQRYSGYRVGVSEDFTKSGATAIARRYRVGKTVTAWVDPTDPSLAVLDLSETALTLSGVWGWIVMLGALGVLFLLVGTGVIGVYAN